MSQLDHLLILPASRPKTLALAVRSLAAGGVLWGTGLSPGWADLPVPADILVAPGAGQVMPPQISGNTMTIHQLSEKATLDWKSFNIGPENTVRFDQPSAASVALNNIHQSDPSRIYGKLTANGQVFLVNQNGFLFGSSAQINVNALVASTLNISEKTFQLGLIQAFDQGGLPALAATDASGQAVNQLFLKDANGKPVLDQHGEKVKIQVFVDKGARLSTNAPNGRIILAAPSITNKGRIEAADGQVILAAAQDKVFLQLADSQSELRGLLVEVGTGGDVNNLGKIIAERGNASLIGFAVNQRGLVSATTSVKLNGSVRLLAREGAQDPKTTQGRLLPQRSRRAEDLGDGLGTRAKLTLAGGSLTRVDPVRNKTETAVDAQDQPRSRIEISGHTVLARAGSEIRAKSGIVQVSATDDPKLSANPRNLPVQGDSRIYLEPGSRIDVSGVRNLVRPMARNVVEIELRSNELRDSPLQKNGVLHGKTVAVDLRDVVYHPEDGTYRIPIADVTGAVARIARNIDERSTRGGSISLESTGDLIARPGSVLDFSGGSVRYRDGYVDTTKLLALGLLYDIGKADPNRRYEGLFGDIVRRTTGSGSVTERTQPIVRTHAKWGVTKTWSVLGMDSKRFERGYVDGKDGGDLNIAAFNAELDAMLLGKTVAGPLQRTHDKQPSGSSLAIDLAREAKESSAVRGSGRQDVVFAVHKPSGTAVNDPFPTEPTDPKQPVPLTLDPALFMRAGIQKVSIKTNGETTIPSGSRIVLPANGSFHIAGGAFDIQGAIVAPSGDVTLKPGPFAVYTPTATAPLTLGRTGSIDVGGLWVNDWLDAGRGRPLAQIALDGGSVTLAAGQGDLTLEPGSRVDVGGGGWLQGNLAVQAGHGGAISLEAVTAKADGLPSSLTLEGELRGWALYGGGTLRVRTNEVVIGGAAPERPGSPYKPLLLTSGFFSRGGFSGFDIGSNRYGLAVADGVVIAPRQRNLELPAHPETFATGERLDEFARIATLPDFLRKPVDLALSFSQVLAPKYGEKLHIGRGAVIQTDPRATVALKSDTSIRVEGTIEAPAGRITLELVPPNLDTGFAASQAIWLESSGSLSAQGFTQALVRSTGLKQGEVLKGGTVELHANRGYVVTRPGSLIDVSGSAADLDFWTPSVSRLGAGPSARNIASP